MQVFFGMFLADLSNHPPAQQWCSSRSWTRTILTPSLLVLGFFLASYPEYHPEWMPWSSYLQKFSTYILPEGYDTPRYFTGFGLDLIALSIHFSPKLKDLLSNRFFLWLGKNSFPVFLIHGTLIRWLLAWCFYGLTLPQPYQDQEGNWQEAPKLALKGTFTRVFWIPLWFILLYLLAKVWILLVDPLCVRWTAAIERYTALDYGKVEAVSPLPQ